VYKCTCVQTVSYLLFDDGMFNSNDAAHDAGCHGNVVAVAAVAAEPDQDEYNGEEEETGYGDDSD